MYEWVEPYEDEQLKERIEELNRAQQLAAANDRILISTYEELWLPVLSELPEVEYRGRQEYRAPYGRFEIASDVPFHGALWFSPALGTDLPTRLKNIQEWVPASASLDVNGRMVKIKTEQHEITFTNVDISLSARDLLVEINRELVRGKAGIYVWRIEPAKEISPSVPHLYPDGRIPAISNAHTRADVTGYALLQDQPYRHTLVYVGMAAHKTSVESLWASLIRGRGACSMRGASLLADGEIRMVTQPLHEFRLLHAGLISRKALPGQWEAGDDTAYALVFAGAEDTEAELQTVVIKRLQEALPFPVLEGWAGILWERGLQAGFLERLETGGDCLAGMKLDLSRSWQELVQNLLEEEALRV